MRAKITKRTIDTAKPTKRDWFIWDEEVSGFGLKITPMGRKVFILQFRMGGRGTPVQRYTIGRFGSPWTADMARDEALRLQRQIQTGIDPTRAKVAARNEPTVAQFCELYLADGAATKPNKKRRSWIADCGNIRWHIVPLLGAKKISQVTRADVERLQHDIAKGKTAVLVLDG